MNKLKKIIFRANRGESVSEEDVRQALNQDFIVALKDKYDVDRLAS